MGKSPGERCGKQSQHVRAMDWRKRENVRSVGALVSHLHMDFEK